MTSEITPVTHWVYDGQTYDTMEAALAAQKLADFKQLVYSETSGHFDVDEMTRFIMAHRQAVLNFLSTGQSPDDPRLGNIALDALIKIASFSEGRKVTGGFDEPASASIARAALDDLGYVHDYSKDYRS